MKRFSVLLLLIFLATAAAARVPREGDLSYAFQLKLEDGLPYVDVTLKNHTSVPLEFELPAGLRLDGKHEPCLPVLLGQDILFKLPPREAKTLRIQVFSLYNFQHTEGEYQATLFMPEDELTLSGKLQEIWDLHYRNQLPADPFRVGQVVVFLHHGAEIGQISTMFSTEEIQAAGRIHKGSP